MPKKKINRETFVSKWYSVDQCRKNPNSLFIYGDNLLRQGAGGQAIIREQRNSFGIASKKAPGMKEEDFFTDSEYEENCKVIDQDIKALKEYADSIDAKAYVFPFQGIGSGLAALQTKAPKTFCYLTCKLVDEFSFNNIAALKSI